MHNNRDVISAKTPKQPMVSDLFFYSQSINVYDRIWIVEMDDPGLLPMRNVFLLECFIRATDAAFAFYRSFLRYENSLECHPTVWEVRATR